MDCRTCIGDNCVVVDAGKVHGRVGVCRQGTSVAKAGGVRVIAPGRAHFVPQRIPLCPAEAPVRRRSGRKHAVAAGDVRGGWVGVQVAVGVEVHAALALGVKVRVTACIARMRAGKRRRVCSRGRRGPRACVGVVRVKVRVGVTVDGQFTTTVDAR